MDENFGYLIVLNPKINLRIFENRSTLKKYKKEYREYRSAFSSYDPLKYRGISRRPLSAHYPLVDKIHQLYKKVGFDERLSFKIDKEIVQWHKNNQLDYNKEARVHMYELVEYKLERVDDRGFESDEDLLQTLDEAIEVYNLLNNPSDYEIICVKRVNFECNPNTIGFDIGYWGGDHYSLIADTIVTPTWHGPPEEEYMEVSGKVGALNKFLLFDAVEDAADFKEYYISKDWAEKEFEPGEFSMIQVDVVNFE